MKWLPIVAVFVGLAVAGCGGEDDPERVATTPRPTTTDTVERSPQAEIEDSVRRAVAENARLSRYAGWHLKMPAWASRSTTGAALSELRRSVAVNRRAGVRARFTRVQLDIRSIDVDPSFDAATVVVATDDRALVYRRGREHPRHPVAVRERARLDLKRVPTSDEPRFVVSRVRLLR